MKKHFIGFLILLNISTIASAQEGKSFGLQGGVGTGGLNGFKGYNSGILTTAGIFKQWMKTNKKSYQPSFGVEMQLDICFNNMDNGNGSSFNVTAFTLPLLFKINLASRTAAIPIKDEQGKSKTAFVFRGIYLFAGPEAGYLSTNVKGPGTLIPFFGGGMAGLQIWVGNWKIEASGNRSFSALYKGNTNYVYSGTLSLGVAF